MAKVLGITNLRGTINGLVYYMLNGQQMVRKAPEKRRGPKTEGMKNAEKSSSEFGKAAKAGKYLRAALEPECLLLRNRYLSQQVTGLMIQLKALHDSPLGSRTAPGGLLTPEGKELMARFKFHNHTARFPRLLRAVSQGSEIKLYSTSCRNASGKIIVLRINFETGDFRRHEYSLLPRGPKKPLVLKKKYRSRKGYTELLFISGTDFLQGIVLKSAEEPDKKEMTNGET